MWDATSAAAVGAYDYATRKKTAERDEFWASLKGKYESANALAADIYEAVQENPGAYFQKIWGKIVDVVGPLVASYDCLKPQKKVEGICGFVAGWVIPPAMLAKILVRGVKELKFLKDHGTISVTEKGKLAKALAHSEQRSKLTLKEIMELEKKVKDLGYTQEEFELLHITGALAKYKIDELFPVSTAVGKAQREMMLGKKKVEAAAALTLSAQRAKSEATREARVNQARQVPADANPSRPDSLGTVDVREVGWEDFNEAKREIAARAEAAERAAKAKKAAEDAAIKATAARKGLLIDEIAPDDQKMSMFETLKATGDDGGGKLATTSEATTRYEGGIDFTTSSGEGPKKIIKTEERREVKSTTQPKEEFGKYKTPYLKVFGKDSMGITNFMPAHITKTATEGGVVVYYVNVVDKATQKIIKERLTERDFKLKYKTIKENPEVEKEIKRFYRATGYGDTSVP